MMNKLIPYKEATNLLSLTEKVAQSFMPAAYINDSEEEIRALENMIRTTGVGGICFFHSRASAATNFEGPKEVIYNQQSLEVLKKLIKRYQEAASNPLLISIDAEWGLAMRIENTRQYPYAITLGAMQDQEELIYEVGRQIGVDCRQAGIHWNFAPVADVNNNPENPVIGYRSFGETPELVTKYALAFCKGLQSSGILTSVKHFPGHGDTSTDSHLGLPVIDKTREQLFDNELNPFIALIEKGVDSVMIGHLSVPALNSGKSEAASVSRSVIHDFLRSELGFDGVVVSDALNMHAVTKSFSKKGELEKTAYEAGTDVLCYAEHVPEGISAILQNCSGKEIEKHFERVWRIKEKVQSLPQPKEIFGPADYSELIGKLAEKSLTNFKGSDDLCYRFRESGFTCFPLLPGRNSLFLSSIKESIGEACNFSKSKDPSEIDVLLEGQEHVLLAVYPPSVKPAKNFGFSDRDIKWIEDLVKNRRAILYLFGNPYFLNVIDTEHFEGIWVAFQDFPEFERHATQHFLGKATAHGVLSVSIKMKQG